MINIFIVIILAESAVNAVQCFLKMWQLTTTLLSVVSSRMLNRPHFVETRATLHVLRLGISLGNSFGKIERVNVGELVRYTQMKVR